MAGKLIVLLAAVAMLLGLAAATSVPAVQASDQARAMPDGKVVVARSSGTSAPRGAGSG